MTSAKVNNNGGYTMYNQTLYEVQRILSMKWVKNKQFCLIKWKGYGSEHNTWEPKDHITFCYNYIAPEQAEDPEYQQFNRSEKNNSNHNYHTRGKKKVKIQTTYENEQAKSEISYEKYYSQEKQDLRTSSKQNRIKEDYYQESKSQSDSDYQLRRKNRKDRKNTQNIQEENQKINRDIFPKIKTRIQPIQAQQSEKQIEKQQCLYKKEKQEYFLPKEHVKKQKIQEKEKTHKIKIQKNKVKETSAEEHSSNDMDPNSVKKVLCRVEGRQQDDWKVQLNCGYVTYMNNQTLKQNYPSKLIAYYEMLIKEESQGMSK